MGNKALQCTNCNDTIYYILITLVTHMRGCGAVLPLSGQSFSYQNWIRNVTFQAKNQHSGRQRRLQRNAQNRICNFYITCVYSQRRKIRQISLFVYCTFMPRLQNRWSSVGTLYLKKWCCFRTLSMWYWITNVILIYVHYTYLKYKKLHMLL